LKKEFKIRNQLGLHLRAAAQFVKLANGFESDIKVLKENTSVNGKSIMGLAMLAAGRGTNIMVLADGPDADEAVEAIGNLIDSKFGEE